MSLLAALRRTLSPTFRLDVAIDVPAGITILFGPSGSGKSSVLRCIAGLSHADGGRITLNDAVLRVMRPASA